MKRFIAILALVCIATAVFAHPPKDVALSYDQKTMMLSITVTHPIKQSPATDPKKHFVKDITLKVNGTQVLITNYSYQQFDEGEIISVKVPLKAADKVSVTAKCSLAGEKTTELTIK
jgi:hypothetical protein